MSTSTANQILSCLGQLKVDIGTSQNVPSQGAVKFVGKLVNKEVEYAAMKVYGFAGFGYLLLESLPTNLQQGFAIRTLASQGGSEVQGGGEPYVLQAIGDQVKMKSVLISTVKSNANPQTGQIVLTCQRSSTEDSPTLYFSHGLEISQSSYKNGEGLFMGVGGSGIYAYYGMKSPLGSASSSLNLGSMGMKNGNNYSEVMTFDSNKIITMPGTLNVESINATTYGNLPAFDPLPITLDKTNNRVGINQISPTQALDVVGNGVFSGTMTANTVSATTYVGLPPVVIPSSEFLPITLDKVNNRVGINNTTPSQSLDVVGNTLLTGTTTITGDLNADSGLLFVNATTNRVGVLTTTPAVALDVVGDLNASGRLCTASFNIAVGNEAGSITQGANTVAIGNGSGRSNQGASSVAVGSLAGRTTQGSFAVAIGSSAGNSNQSANSVAIGLNSGVTSQGTSSVAIGPIAGNANQGNGSIAIGLSAGSSNQNNRGIAIGEQAGQTSQGLSTIAIGFLAGNNTQSQTGIAIGNESGRNTQGQYAVAVGTSAGRGTQGARGVAFGFEAAYTTQGSDAVAVGAQSGYSNQSTRAVSIGFNAGTTSQGSAAIAIGSLAGQTNQHANSIILNATNVALNSDGTSRLYISPLREVSTDMAMFYNTTSKEVSYGPALAASWSVTRNTSFFSANTRVTYLTDICSPYLCTVDKAAGTVTVNKSGRYFVAFNALIYQAVNGVAEIWIRKNSTDLVRNYCETIGSHPLTVSTILDCVVGDVIDVFPKSLITIEGYTASFSGHSITL